MSPSELRKLHNQLGHATATQMKTFLRESQTCNPSYSSLIDMITTNCSCVLVAPPVPLPVCAATATLEGSQAHGRTHIRWRLILRPKTFLHVINDKTRWSEVGALQTRQLCGQIGVLKHIQFYRHGILKLASADQAYNTKKGFDILQVL